MPQVPANLDWLFSAIGGVIALVSVWVLVWALFRDRARAKFRCPRCWYDLTGAEGAAPQLPVTCSECGRATAKVSLLRKTRRRWAWAVVAMVMLPASGVIAAYPKAHRHGLLSLVPTRLLVDTIPIFGYPTRLTDELLLRCGGWSRLPRWTWGPARPPALLTEAEDAYVLSRLGAGAPGARPVSDAWQRAYGAFARDSSTWMRNLRMIYMGVQPEQASPAGAQLLAAMEQMFSLPPIVTARTRPVWPTEYPVWVEVSHEDWWPDDASCTFKWRQGESGTWRDCTESTGTRIDDAKIDSQGAIELEVQALWNSNPRFQGAGGGKRHDKSFALSVPCRIEGSFADIMKPVTTPQLDLYMRQIVEESIGFVRINPGATRGQYGSDFAFGIIAEYTHNDRVIARARHWWSGYANTPGAEQLEGHLPRFKSGDVIIVRIRSDPEAALRVIGADKYWVGDVTVDVTIP